MELSIPRTVHQTWKSKDPRTWSARQRRWVESWRTRSGWTHALYDDQDCERLIQDVCPELLQPYRALRPVERADVWRIAQLLRHGGMYCDVDTVCRAPLDRWIHSSDRLVLGLMADHTDRYPAWRPQHVLRSGGVFDPACVWRDNLVLFHNGALAARPGHPLLTDVLQRIAVNLTDPFFVDEDVGLICKKTGPGVLTDAVEAHVVHHGSSLAEIGLRLRRESDVRIGDVRLLDYGAFHGRWLRHVGMRTWEPRRGFARLAQRVWEAFV